MSLKYLNRKKTLLDRGIIIAQQVMGRRDNQPIPLSQDESETLSLALLQAFAPDVPPGVDRDLLRDLSILLDLAHAKRQACTDTDDRESWEACCARVQNLYETLKEHAQVEGDSLVGTQVKSANAVQVGGSHYGLDAFQHWDVVVKFGLDYFQGQITKYVFRWRSKNGVQDLLKAKHFLEKYIEEIQAGRIK